MRQWKKSLPFLLLSWFYKSLHPFYCSRFFFFPAWKILACNSLLTFSVPKSEMMFSWCFQTKILFQPIISICVLKPLVIHFPSFPHGTSSTAWSSEQLNFPSRELWSFHGETEGGRDKCQWQHVAVKCEQQKQNSPKACENTCHLLLVHLPGTWKSSCNSGRQHGLWDLKSHPGLWSQISVTANSNWVVWELQTGITLATHPHSFQEHHDCSQGPWDFCRRPLENWTSWLCVEREEGLFYWKAAGMSTDQSYPVTQPWKTLEEEIAENSSYPLDKTQQDQFFLFLRLLFEMVLEGLSLWVLCLSPGGREWMRSKCSMRSNGQCSMILHPTGLGYPTAGCSSPIQNVRKKTVFPFPEFLTNSFPLHTCPFVYPCFIFIFWRSRCLERELVGLSATSSHLTSKGFSVSGEFSFPFSSHQPDSFSGNCLPESANPFLPYLLYSLAAKREFSNCSPQSGLTNPCQEIAGQERAAEKADCHYRPKYSHWGLWQLKTCSLMALRVNYCTPVLLFYFIIFNLI